MRCLRVRLVTGPREAQGISRDDNKTVPRVSSGGRWLEDPPLRFAKAPESSKSRAERQGASPCPQGCGFRAQGADEDLTYSPSRRSAPFGETEKEKRKAARRPMLPGCEALVWFRGLFDIVNLNLMRAASRNQMRRAR
jgi:hypothetical protein